METRHSSKQPGWNSHKSRPMYFKQGVMSSDKRARLYTSADICEENILLSDEDSEDNIVFLTETDEGGSAKSTISPWKILIADDDSNVHDTTVLALSGVEIHGKPLEFLHAFSAREAQQVAENNPDTSLILLDVVMETVDAGLKLVNILRDDLSRKNLRIVLRTGQPGYAKENIMGSYAIDGYATKSKLTRSILISMLNEVLDSDVDSDTLPN
ncbi:response regulator [Undibacterium sp. Ji22W]|uniref:response regulator n=1 Tax=Undibacterium sp. Ji22W TaxID=3413038 RepID=UPI003BF31DC2